MNYKEISRELRANASAEVASQALRFFKSGKGDYGEDDQFLGIRVPMLRKIARRYADLPAKDQKIYFLLPLHQ